MKTLGKSHILEILSCAFYLPLVVCFDKVTIPAELKSVVVKVAVNTTSCSVTCGPGSRLDEMCEMTPAGERRNCTVHRSQCLTTWVCGLQLFTIRVGKPFQLSCLAVDTVGFDSRAYSFTWRFAQGLITTNDLLFRRFINPESVVRFSSTKESAAGTYRCDVRMLKTLRVVKRVYFGVRVIQNTLMDLNFEKSLTQEQKLAANKEEGNAANGTIEEVQPFWEGELFRECLVAVGNGVTGGVLVSMALCVWWKILRR
ncbi:TMM81 protein, partial [Podargus strigoides]|nr:TMM81 protein [Podargus strigoides]